MGRSVSYLRNAEIVLYFPYESEFQEDWEDLISNLQYEIKTRLKSYYACDQWEDREDHIILKNQFCNIAISEYCGLCSLSVALRQDIYNQSYSDTQYKENFGSQHMKQIEKTLQKCLDNLGLGRLNKLGTFSNGESIYQSVNKD